jgi:4-hydroxy-3-polyprenylbenzoate decarboxylase
MITNNLQEFVDFLRNKGELVDVHEPVSAKFEITEISDRVMKSEGPALLFHNVQDSDYPLLINIFGSKRRMAWALGVEDLNEIGGRIEELLELTKGPGKGFMEKLSLIPRLREISKFPPRTTKKAPAQEVVLRGDEVDLERLPVQTCWPDDGGPFITLTMVHTKDPETGERNAGMYRVQRFDRNTVGLHWQRHKTGAAHFEKAKKMGVKLPVAVTLGGDPATIYSASAPLPPGISEFMFAGFLRKEPVKMVKCVTHDIEVPAESEIVIEGYADPEEPLRLEGPFGDHTGFYSLADYYPAMEVTAVTMRKGAIYPSTIVGKPPMEDAWMGYATERIFQPLSRLVMPEIVNYHMPPEGIFHNLVFVAIDKQYPGHAFKVGAGMLGQGLMSLAKMIVVLDADVNVEDTKEAWWATLNNIDPERDIRMMPGPIDVLDHSSRAFSYGSKMIVDATNKWPEEGFDREWPEKIEMSEEIKQLVDQKWERYGIRLD